MRKFIFLFSICFLLLSSLPLVSLAQTEELVNGLNVTAGQAGFSVLTNGISAESNLNRIIGTIINTVLSFTGVIFMVLIIAAGEMWLTAGGNSEQTDKARNLITHAVVGLVIVFSAFIITNYVVPTVLSWVGTA